MNRSSDKRAWRWISPDSTLQPALFSSLLCWLAFPPVGWGALAWLAPIGWLSLVGRDQLAGRRPYRDLWLAGLVFWLLTIHWIRLPHPANYLAWVLLSSYLAVYLPLFVGLARIGVHRLRLPLWLVAPVVWTGLDWVRGNWMTGFLMGSLAHTQVEFPSVIQIANLAGEYAVTFVIVLVAACLTQSLLMTSAQTTAARRFLPWLPATLVLTTVVLYGRTQRFDLTQQATTAAGPRIALIQGNTLAEWKRDPDQQQNIMGQYMTLSLQAVQQSRERDGREVDLVIWPETAFRQTFLTLEEGYQPPAKRIDASHFIAAQTDLGEFVRQTGAAILTGINRVHVFPDEQGEPDYRGYNSSVLMDKQAQVVGTYDKMHLVLLGEYVPFTKWFPILKRLTPITGLATPGEHPQALEVDHFIYCPNICYETTVPHLIRRQVKTLAASGAAPDVLVNITNDAWFWGSSELDIHLACGILRAVEMRLPLVIAANGGLSAHVDAYGNVQQITPRQETAALLVDLPRRATPVLTLYAQWGDWFAGVCVLCCVILAVIGWRNRRGVPPSAA